MCSHSTLAFGCLPTSILQRIADFIDLIDRTAFRSTCRTVLDALGTDDPFSTHELSLPQAQRLFERHARQDFQSLRHVYVNVASWHAHDRQDLTRRVLAARWKELRTLHIISQEPYVHWINRPDELI